MLHTAVLLAAASVHVLDVVGNVRVLDLLRPRRRRERVLDAPSDDVALEQKMDGLERHALGLRHEEDGVDAHDDAARPEQQKRAVCDVGKHDWRDFGDDKVE